MYEVGVTVSLLVSMVRMVALISALNSTLATNLNKVGIRIRWSGGFSSEPSSINPLIKFILACLSALFCSLFSWLGLAIEIGWALSVMSRLSGMPEDVKARLWKLKNENLSAEQVKQILDQSSIIK